MDKPPTAYRSKADEHLFSLQTEDPAIVLDRVSPPVEGYFRIPAIWVGEAPDPQSVLVLNRKVHHSAVFDSTLSCGVRALVQLDGTFLFDFSSWPLAPQILIPGYRIPNPDKPYRPPKATYEAEEKAENYAVIRAQVMNVHQACLTSAERILKGRGAEMGFPVTSWNTEKEFIIDRISAYRDDGTDMRAFARNVLNNSYQITRDQPFSRRTLEVEVVEYSMKMLDEILSREDNALIDLIDMAYMAASRYVEKRFGEAVVLSWAVCEQILSSIWNEHQIEIESNDRMTRTRRKKLLGRDYTVSVMVEVLEMNRKISYDAYVLLEQVRKVRNKWVHDMQAPDELNVRKAISAVEILFREYKDINLSFGSGPPGGVPQLNMWAWKQISKN